MATLRSILDQEGGPAFTRSELEDRFLEALRRSELPLPRTNVRVGRHEVDCYWPDARFVVELDGGAYHRSWNSQQADRRRDSDLGTLDIQVMRITWHQLVHEPAPTLARLALTLGMRRERLRRDRNA